jgi:hypothetical protein
MKIRQLIAALTLMLVLSFAARAQSSCTITGTLYEQDGVTPLKDADVSVTVTQVNGLNVSGDERTYNTGDTGTISFVVPQGAQIRVSSIAVPFNRGGQITDSPQCFNCGAFRATCRCEYPDSGFDSEG